MDAGIGHAARWERVVRGWMVAALVLLKPLNKFFKLLAMLLQKFDTLLKLANGCILRIDAVDEVVHHVRAMRILKRLTMAANNTPWYSDHRAVRRDIFVHDGVSADHALVADGDRPENLRAHPDQNAISNGRMALYLLETGSPESNLMVHQDVIANYGSLANHHSVTMVNKESAADDGSRMDFDTRNEPGELGDEASCELAAMCPKPVRHVMQPQRMQTWITQNLELAPRSRILRDHRIDIFS